VRPEVAAMRPMASLVKLSHALAILSLVLTVAMTVTQLG